MSTTLTVKLAVPWLLRGSVAVQLTVVVPRGNVEPGAGSHPTKAIGVPRSTAVGGVNVTFEPPGAFASTERFAGTLLSVGAVVSTTFTWNEPLAEFPRPSPAVQFTVVVAIAKVAPEAGVQLTLTAAPRSVADALNVTAAPVPDVASALMSDGRLSVGSWVSRTCTVKLPFATLPWPSSAEQFTVVVVIGKVAPEPGLHETPTGAPKSVALAE